MKSIKLLLLKDRNIWPLRCKAGQTVEVEESIAIKWVEKNIAIKVNDQNKKGK